MHTYNIYIYIYVYVWIKLPACIHTIDAVIGNKCTVKRLQCCFLYLLTTTDFIAILLISILTLACIISSLIRVLYTVRTSCTMYIGRIRTLIQLWIKNQNIHNCTHQHKHKEHILSSDITSLLHNINITKSSYRNICLNILYYKNDNIALNKLSTMLSIWWGCG